MENLINKQIEFQEFELSKSQRELIELFNQLGRISMRGCGVEERLDMITNNNPVGDVRVERKELKNMMNDLRDVIKELFYTK